MSDSETSSFSLFLEHSHSKTSMSDNSDHTMNETEIVIPKFYRPAPASMKRKREQEAIKKELLKMCKPLSIKLDRIPQQVITKLIKKCEHTPRNKKRNNRWQKGFADKRKRTKSEKSTEKSIERSLEASKSPHSFEMTPSHPWGCCRIIPFERHKSRTHRKFSVGKSRESVSPGGLKQAISNKSICESSIPKIALRDKTSQEDNRLIIRAKENALIKDVPLNTEVNSASCLPDTEQTSSNCKAESTSQIQEDEFVCRRTIPYIRKTSYKPIFDFNVDHTPQPGCSKSFSSFESYAHSQLQIYKELKPKSSKSSRGEKGNSESEKEYSGCSKTEPFIFKNRSRDRDKILQQSIMNTKSAVYKRSSHLESKIREKTEKTKASELSVLKDDSDNIEDDFSWGSSSMWRIKRKHRVRRISSTTSSEDEVPKKKTKNLTHDLNRSSEKRQDSHEKIKLPSATGMQTLCPPSCTNHEHQSSILNFLFRKPKVISLKKGQVVLERLENMVNDPYVIRWRKNMIKQENEELEEEYEKETEEALEDQRYYMMYDDGTVSNQALSQQAIYQMGDMTNYQIEEPSQLYKKVSYEKNSYESDMINTCPIDVSKYFSNNESLPVEDNMLPVDLVRVNDVKVDDTLTDVNLREGVSRNNDLKDDVSEFNEYPKVLLIRLETLVGILDSDYSSSEIEALEEKYIDFIMNSNFSYDKQSQSYFAVYKRLHAKQAKERELEALQHNNVNSLICMDGDTFENNEMDETYSTDDDPDEKPLVIAFDADREENLEDWVTDESSVNSLLGEFHNSENLSTCEKSTGSPTTSLVKDTGEKVPHNNNSDSTPIEFVTCDKIYESETPKEPLLISCKFCKVSFRSLHSFSLHKSDCHLKNKEPMKCEYCGKPYKCRRTLKLHIQFIHGNGDSVMKNTKKNTEKRTPEKSSKTIAKTTSSAKGKVSIATKKKSVPAAQKNLCCGVCSVAFETKESLWDHVYKHTEKELQDAYTDATKSRKDEELRNKIERFEKKKKDTQNKMTKKSVDVKKDKRELANKYAQWKDRILCKNSGNEEADTSRNSEMNQNEEVVVSSSESSEFKKNKDKKDNVENNKTTSKNSCIKSTELKQQETEVVAKPVTMCPCHSNDTSTMVNGDMQIEMVLLCEICQVLFRRRDCFEVHYRVNRLCNLDRTSRLPKLFCSSCRIILNSLPEMRHHLEKHAEVNRQGSVTFLCNICKVMFFGVGSLFYSHWFNHNKDVNFHASRYSFPKLSIVPIMSLAEKVGGQSQKEEYLFVAEYVCKDCKIPFGSESDLKYHVCSRSSVVVDNESQVPKEVIEKQPEAIKNIVRVNCLSCQKVYVNKSVYDVHDKEHININTPKLQYYCVATINEQKAYICSRCKTVRMSMDDLKEHWIFHRPWREKFSCANCSNVQADKFEEIEEHCQRCDKNLQSVCNVSMVSAIYKCQPCQLYFETSNEWKEHHQVCSRSTIVAKKTNTTNLEVVNSISSVLSTVIPAIESSGSPANPLIIPITVTSTIPNKDSSKGTTSVKATVAPLKSNLNNSFQSIFSKPSTVMFHTAASTLLEKYLLLGSITTEKPKSKRQVNQDVEIIDILSESSSRSSVAELGKEASSSKNADASKSLSLLTTNEELPASDEENSFESYTSGKLQFEYNQKDVSLSKSVICYPPKKKIDKTKQHLVTASVNSVTKSPTSPTSKETSGEGTDKTNLATMTAVNPEFETLLTELEDLENGKKSLKKNLKIFSDVSKKSFNIESTLETSTNDSTKLNEELLISETGSLSVVSEATSSKSIEKETLSPLPFEVILLPEEENAASPKLGAIAENSVTRVDINSNKSVSDQNSTSDNSIGSNPVVRTETVNKILMNNKTSDKGSPNEPNTASIIEEYIEYVMMDESGNNRCTTQTKNNNPTVSEPNKEPPPPVEKVAPTRLRVRPLAELQEIKTYICDICGQSINTKIGFDQHMKAKHSSKSKSKTKGHQQLLTKYTQHQDKASPSEMTTKVDYEGTLAQNLARRDAGSPKMNFIPPLLPLSHGNINVTNSKSVTTPVSSNLVIPETRHSGSSFGNTSTELNQPSNSGFNSTSHVPRSGAIQLPERTGGSSLQKRPSGAATRIQNFSQPPSAIQHRGLPPLYVNRNTGRSNNSMGSSSRPPFTPNNLTPIRHVLEKSNSLICTTCNYTAKSLTEFSTHLLMHFMDTSTNEDQATPMVNQEMQSIDPALGNSLNTPVYQNSQITASDIYGARSSSNSTPGTWQTPAKYIYACQLCNFRTETKASIRLHEKNHMAITPMRQKNLDRIQNRHLVQDTIQVQPHHQQGQPQISSTKSNADSRNSVILYTRVGNDIYQCQLCHNFLFSMQDEFMRHLQTAHKQVRKESTANPVSDNGTVCFVCDYCETPQIFESEIALRKHMNFLHNHVCNICSQRCTSRELLNSHILSHKINC